jgi:hypothetical protein
VKLKFEHFEGLTSLSVRGDLAGTEVKILQVGLESIVKDLDSPLIVNLVLAKIPEVLAPVLIAIKKTLPGQTTFKIHWISPIKNVGEFPALDTFVSRLTGFKHRQIGERLVLDDQIHELHEKVIALEARLGDVSGDAEKAHEMILRNLALKEQERILKASIHFQRERIKLQTPVPSSNKEVKVKTSEAREAIKKAYGLDFDL